MRLLLLSAFIAFASRCGAASASMISGEAWSRSLTATNQVQRSLRGYVEEVGEDEDRTPGGTSIEKAAEKLDDALATVLHRPPHRLPTGLSSAGLAKIDDVIPKVEAAMKNYPEGLSASALKQLRQVEEQRIKDAPLFAKVNKKSSEGMQRKIEPFPGMKTAPTMTSHVGRNEQVYTNKGGRMVVCGVVTRPEIEGGGILLISSSKFSKQQFVLPKGGLENHESARMGMRRELMEEGGVSATFKANLGDSTVNDKTYKFFLMHADETFDQWPESMRYRVWFKWDDAITILKDKYPEMAPIVERARKVAAKMQ